MSEQNERYEVEHGGDADHGGNHRPAIAPRPEEPSVCGSNLECPDVLHQALNFPISLFQFFNFSIFFGRNQPIDGRRRRQARRTLPFASRRRACERPERASARTKSGAMIPRKKQRAKRLPGANAQFFSRRNTDQRQRIDAAERGGHFAPPISRIGRVFRAICEFWRSCALENTAQPGFMLTS